MKNPNSDLSHCRPSIRHMNTFNKNRQYSTDNFNNNQHSELNSRISQKNKNSYDESIESYNLYLEISQEKKKDNLNKSILNKQEVSTSDYKI